MRRERSDEHEVGLGRTIGTPRGGAREANERNERMRPVIMPQEDTPSHGYRSYEDRGISTRYEGPEKTPDPDNSTGESHLPVSNKGQEWCC